MRPDVLMFVGLALLVFSQMLSIILPEVFRIPKQVKYAIYLAYIVYFAVVLYSIFQQ